MKLTYWFWITVVCAVIETIIAYDATTHQFTHWRVAVYAAALLWLLVLSTLIAYYAEA